MARFGPGLPQGVADFAIGTPASGSGNVGRVPRMADNGSQALRPGARLEVATLDATGGSQRDGSMGLLGIRSFQLAMALVAAFLLADLVWLGLSPIAFDWASAKGVGRAAVVVVLLTALLSLIDRRLEGDRSPIARGLRFLANGARVLALALGAMVALTTAVAILSYLAVSTNLPLQDARYAAMDRAMGFNWLGFLAFVNDRPWLARCLTAAYHTSLIQIFAVLGLLSLLQRTQDLADFIAIFAVTSGVVIVVSALVPAAGAVLHYNPEASLRTSFQAIAGRWHWDDFTALRDGRYSLISLAQIEGLVTFPSFHTVMAIMTTYAVRSLMLVFWPVALLNFVVVVSTLPEGGHYLIDVIAGGLIALAAIAVVARLGQREGAAEAAGARPSSPAGGFVWRPADHETASSTR